MSETPRKRLTLRQLKLRWLSLGEFVGVAALLIAALGYWDTHREHAQEANDRAAADKQRQAEAAADALKHSFLLVGRPNGSGDTVRLTTVNADQVIQTQTVWFPAAVRGDSVETTGDPRLEAGWIDQGLRKNAGDAKAGRVPVGVQTVFIEDGQTKTDRALYWLGFSLHPRLLGGDRVALEGLSLVRRGVTGDLQAATNGMWGRK